MKPKQNLTIEQNRTVFSIKDESQDVVARFFDTKVAMGYCRSIGVSPAKNIHKELVDIIWINGAARIIGPEIRNEYVSSRFTSSIPPSK